MGIGAYRHLVTLEHPAVRARSADVVLRDPVGGRRRSIDGLAAFFVRGRFHPGITLETRVIFEGRTLQVQSVTDLDERHVELRLMCVEVVGRGRERSDVSTGSTSCGRRC